MNMELLQDIIRNLSPQGKAFANKLYAGLEDLYKATIKFQRGVVQDLLQVLGKRADRIARKL